MESLVIVFALTFIGISLIWMMYMRSSILKYLEASKRFLDTDISRPLEETEDAIRLFDDTLCVIKEHIDNPKVIEELNTYIGRRNAIVERHNTTAADFSKALSDLNDILEG